MYYNLLAHCLDGLHCSALLCILNTWYTVLQIINVKSKHHLILNFAISGYLHYKHCMIEHLWSLVLHLSIMVLLNLIEKQVGKLGMNLLNTSIS